MLRADRGAGALLGVHKLVVVEHIGQESLGCEGEMCQGFMIEGRGV